MNTVMGQLLFVTPTSIEKTGHVEDEDAALDYLATIRPTSNIVHAYGRLTRDPKKVIPKSGLVISQYQIGLLRHLMIRDDPPEIRVDYPWVKSYGEAAESDKNRLMVGSIVHIDGFLQTRNVCRHLKCEFCGKNYDWIDKAMEVVPYETEYVKNYRSDEEIEEVKKARLEQIKRDLAARHLTEQDYAAYRSAINSDIITKEDVAAGMDSLETEGLFNNYTDEE